MLGELGAVAKAAARERGLGAHRFSMAHCGRAHRRSPEQRCGQGSGDAAPGKGLHHHDMAKAINSFTANPCRPALRGRLQRP